MMRGALILGLTLISAAHGAERAEEFAHRAPLVFAPGQAIYQVELPLAVHQGARRADLGDLRVFNGAGEVVPHALRAVTSDPREEPSFEVKVFPYRASPRAAELAVMPDARIELRPGGAVVIDVRGGLAATPGDERATAYFFDAGATDKPLKALKLDWEPAAGGFSGRVDLHASDDLRHWRALTTAAAILDLQMDGQRLELSRIEFPATRLRYLRMTWPAGQAMPAVRSASVEPAMAQAQTMRRSTVHEVQRSEKEGEYLVDLGAPLRVQKVQIDLPQQNTVSAIELLARARPADPWQHIDRSTYYRLLHGGQEWRNPERTVSAPSARYWQLKVDSRGGGLGSGTPKLRVTWEPRLLVFVARGEGPFLLAFGHAKYAPADFRIESLIPGLSESKPVAVAEATLGPIDASSGAETSRGSADALYESLTGEQGRRWLLWTVLIVGVAVLAIMAWRMAKGLGDTQRRE